MRKYVVTMIVMVHDPSIVADELEGLLIDAVETTPAAVTYIKAGRIN